MYIKLKIYKKNAAYKVDRFKKPLYFISTNFYFSFVNILKEILFRIVYMTLINKNPQNIKIYLNELLKFVYSTFYILLLKKYKIIF